MELCVLPPFRLCLYWPEAFSGNKMKLGKKKKSQCCFIFRGSSDLIEVLWCKPNHRRSNWRKNNNKKNPNKRTKYNWMKQSGKETLRASVGVSGGLGGRRDDICFQPGVTRDVCVFSCCWWEETRGWTVVMAFSTTDSSPRPVGHYTIFDRLSCPLLFFFFFFFWDCAHSFVFFCGQKTRSRFMKLASCTSHVSCRVCRKWRGEEKAVEI